jgi:hypothetical protein
VSSRLRRAGSAAVVALALFAAGCANIPDQSTAQALQDASKSSTGPIAEPDPKTDPMTLVRDFIGQAGNPAAAKIYLTDQARQTWPSDNLPTIIADTFNTTPPPVQDRKAQGDDQTNEVTVVLTVTNVGRLGADGAFIPAVGISSYDVVVRRAAVGAVWRIQSPPPNTVLITQPDFNRSYQQVSIPFFDPGFRVMVPDLRYVPALPVGGVPDRVIRRLLEGPSDTLRSAVRTELPSDAGLQTNVVSEPDGAWVVNLTRIGDKTQEERGLIAAQLVSSLKDVTRSQIRLLVDGHPLIPGHGDWRPSDVPSYETQTKPNAELPGLFTANGRIFSLRDATPIPGPAGNGELNVQSAAQTVDGKNLAVVQVVPTGTRLRIGEMEGNLAEVDLKPSTLTRPTWLLGTSTAPSNEVWTVQNGVDVVRVVRTGNGSWVPSVVNASALKSYGTISDLRLSRDGVRIAAVASGQVVVASVVRDKDSVMINAPRALQMSQVRGVVGVDWHGLDEVAAVTSQSGQPVVRISVDGFYLTAYSTSNLGTPVSALAAAPDRDVVVTDRSNMWAVSGVAQVWRLLHQVPGARPFYPG